MLTSPGEPRRANPAEARIAAKAFKGVTGDPWAPVTTEAEPKSLTLGDGDFTYKKLCELMLDHWRRLLWHWCGRFSWCLPK